MQTTSNEIQLMIPDERWMNAPAFQTWRFYPVYSQVARALHQSMRDELPAIYFRDPARLLNVRQSYPMLVFQASRPCTSQANLFCHDVLDAEIMDTFFRMSRAKLIHGLEAARAAALAAGLKDTAAHYYGRHAKHVIESTRKNVTFRRPLNKMLLVEAAMLHDLIAFAGKYPPSQRAKRIADFNRRWNIHLRRFFGTTDFTEAGPKLLSAATAALTRTQQKLDDEFSTGTPYDWAA